MKSPILTFLLAGSLLLGACASQTKVTLLSAAGFHTVVPTTAAQIAKVKSLPQRKVVPVVKNGKTLFLYADAANNVLLVGNQKQYQQFQQYHLQYNIQQAQEETAALNADAADWGCWGGGFWGPGFMY